MVSYCHLHHCLQLPSCNPLSTAAWGVTASEQQPTLFYEVFSCVEASEISPAGFRQGKDNQIECCCVIFYSASSQICNVFPFKLVTKKKFPKQSQISVDTISLQFRFLLQKEQNNMQKIFKYQKDPETIFHFGQVFCPGMKCVLWLFYFRIAVTKNWKIKAEYSSLFWKAIFLEDWLHLSSPVFLPTHLSCSVEPNPHASSSPSRTHYL